MKINFHDYNLFLKLRYSSFHTDMTKRSHYVETTVLISRSCLRRCSMKKVFLKLSQNSKKNTCTRASFLIKLQIEACKKRDFGTDVFLWILWNFVGKLFFRTFFQGWLLLDFYKIRTSPINRSKQSWKFYSSFNFILKLRFWSVWSVFIFSCWIIQKQSSRSVL